MKKVCHITTVHKAIDGRIFYKECRSLVRQGYVVYVVGVWSKDEQRDGVHIVGLKEYSGRFKRFFNSFVAMRKALKTGASVMHLHDPELLLIGFLLKLCGKKVVFDSHENLYLQLSCETSVKQWVPRPFRRIFAFMYLLVEKLSVRFFDAWIYVADNPQNPHNFLSAYPRHVHKFYLVRNFPILSLIDNIPSLDIEKKKPIIIYVGGLTAGRGIYELIEAMHSVRTDATLLLIGQWEGEEYKKKCFDHMPHGKVEWKDWMPVEKLYGYIKKADVGIVTILPELNHMNTFAIKTFEYMACGLPVIMSDFPFWIHFFGSENAIFVNPSNSAGIAEKIDLLLQDKALAVRLGQNGRKRVEEELCWEKEQETLFRLYKKLLNED